MSELQETLGNRGLDPNADTTGRVGLVLCFTEQKVNLQVVWQVRVKAKKSPTKVK